MKNSVFIFVLLITMMALFVSCLNNKEKLTENLDRTNEEVEYIKSVSNSKKPKKNEKYYDYNYIVNAPKRTYVEKPTIDDRDLAQVLSNTVGTPTNQVYTDFNLEDPGRNKYKSWDKYFLPGYSYFPPSKWQVPLDNTIKIPPMFFKNTNVCPLTVNNVWSEYLSGDEIAKQINQSKSQPMPESV